MLQYEEVPISINPLESINRSIQHINNKRVPPASTSFLFYSSLFFITRILSTKDSLSSTQRCHSLVFLVAAVTEIKTIDYSNRHTDLSTSLVCNLITLPTTTSS